MLKRLWFIFLLIVPAPLLAMQTSSISLTRDVGNVILHFNDHSGTTMRFEMNHLMSGSTDAHVFFTSSGWNDWGIQTDGAGTTTITYGNNELKAVHGIGVSMWFKPSKMQFGDIIASNSNSRFIAYTKADGTFEQDMYFGSEPGETVFKSTVTTYNMNQWNHYCGNYDDTSKTFHGLINGKLVIQGTVAGGSLVDNTWTGWFLGGVFQPYVGFLDELNIRTTGPFSDGECKQFYLQGKGMTNIPGSTPR